MEHYADRVMELLEGVPVADKVAELIDSMVDQWKEAEDRATDAASDLDAAEKEADEAVTLAESYKAQLADAEAVTYEAKGRIMERQDPKAVLEWVLTQVSGEEVVL